MVVAVDTEVDRRIVGTAVVDTEDDYSLAVGIVGTVVGMDCYMFVVGEYSSGLLQPCYAHNLYRMRLKKLQTCHRQGRSGQPVVESGFHILDRTFSL